MASVSANVDLLIKWLGNLTNQKLTNKQIYILRDVGEQV